MVCPNCGAQLPDTATMCYSCRVYFNHENHVYYENKSDYIEQTGASLPNQQEDKTLYYAGMIMGVIAGILILVSAFVPYISFSESKQSITLNELSVVYTIEVIVLFIGLVFASALQHGKSNIVVGIIIIGLAIYRYVQYLKVLHETGITSGVHLDIGHPMIIISGVLALVSGILLIYNKMNNEKGG